MATTRIPTYPAQIFYEANWNTGPLSPLPPLWTDTSVKWLGKWDTGRGTDFELNRNQTGQLQPVLDNRAGDFDPGNPAGQWSPNVAPYKGLRIRMPFGVNELTGDQATAGEQTGFPPGLVPIRMNIGSDATAGNLTLAASGSAYQGSQVYQAVLGAGATVGADVLRVVAVPTVPGRTYSFQAQARIPSGTTTSTQAQILWFSQAGVQVGSVSGTAQNLTSGSAAWTTLSASGTAPQGCFMAWLIVQIAAGTLGATTTWQVDGLQYENSGIPTPWQMPGTLGANLLPRVIATGSMAMDPVRDSVANWWYSSGAGTLAQANNLATAAPPGQTSAVAWTTPSGTTSANAVLYVGSNTAAPTGPVADCVQVTATQQYTASAYLSRTASADATVQVTLSIQWYSNTGATLTPSAGAAVTVASGAWVRASVTGTAPAGAVWGRISAAITTPASTTATNTVYGTAFQFEQAAAASAWVDPGPTFYAFWGFFEQLPQVWRLSGTWGELDAVGVDALAGLAQFNIVDPFIHEVSTLNPNFFYPLNDPLGATSVADVSGKRIPAPIENSPYGAGSLTLGNGVTANTPGSAFLGGLGPVATCANSNASSPSQLPETFIALHDTTVSPGPPGTGQPWTRMIAFRAPTLPASGTNPNLWACSTPGYGTNQSFIEINISVGTGKLNVQVLSPNGSTGVLVSFAPNVCDGNWHLVTFGLNAAGTGYTVSLDGVASSGTPTGGDAHPTQCTADTIGAWAQFGGNSYFGGFTGDLAFVAEFPTLLTSAQITNLYGSFRTASSGESTGARFRRLLTWIGYPGPVSIDPGVTQSMGPATDLIGGTALDAAYTIAVTENGDAFASSGGVMTFRQRSALYNGQPLFVFGENQALGEWPYEDVQLPTDPLHTYNIWNIAQWSSGQVATAQDAASQQANFPRTAPALTINTTSFAEVQSAAAYQLSRFKVNRMRCKGLVLHASGIPGLFRVCAQLEKGVRIRVMKRPPWRSTSAPIQFDGFVTNLAWSLDPKSGRVTLTVEAAPADLQSYWTLAALHTNLNAQAASGQNQATINALPDSAVNALSSSLPQGYQLVFDPGTAIQETMTPSPTGIPATGIGYSTATLTFTTNFLFTHQAGAVVCEPLPQGYTDPTTWDANSVIGAASTTLAQGSNSGTNQITVKALADSATNALGCNWNTGDLVWIGVGTAGFEGYNLLTPNQSTAGEGVLPLAAGTAGTAVALTGFYSTPTVAADATAFQGANVWAVSVAGGASTGHTIINLAKVAAAAPLQYTWSIYVRSTTAGQNPQVHSKIQFTDANGNSLGATSGSTVTLTGSPTAAWTRLTVTATAPAATVWASVNVVLSTAPASAWTFQADGLQLEQNSAASTYQTCPQVLSVAASVPGYSSVVITLAGNLANTHQPGETVCDPLPPGTTSVASLAPTARVAY